MELHNWKKASALKLCVFSALSPVHLAPWISEDYSANPLMERSSWDEHISGNHFLTVSCQILHISHISHI